MPQQPAVAVPSVGPWQDATVTAIHDETSNTKTFSLRLAQPALHLAGQHFVVRLTAPDGYSAQRSYSVGSAPGDGSSIDLTIERLPDGEVSTFLHDELRVGDTLEVRGPIGGWFVWDGSTPALLIGGGSGVVPLMSMLRLARRQRQGSPLHLLASVRSPGDLIYADEMVGDDVTVVYTRDVPNGFERTPGRLVVDDLARHVGHAATVYVCGSARFAAAASEFAVEAGFESASIRVERFGPTG